MIQSAWNASKSLSLYSSNHSIIESSHTNILSKQMRSSEKTTHFDARETSEGFICHAIHKWVDTIPTASSVVVSYLDLKFDLISGRGFISPGVWP